MCLSNLYIVNPAFKQNQWKYSTYHFNTDLPDLHCAKVSDGHYYPRNVPHTKFLTINVHNVDEYYAYDDDGSCVNIYLPVRCGKCIECLKEKQNDIRNRMRLEQYGHKVPPIFLTLTYADEFLPKNGVSKDDVAKFFNRFHLYLNRHGMKQQADFRHICFSEYGTLRKRPHYHAILFGVDLSNFGDIMKFHSICHSAWGKGFIFMEQVTPKSFDYVSKYVAKDLIYDNKLPDSYNPNFITGTRRNGGIGTYCLKIPALVEKIMGTSSFPKITIVQYDGTSHTLYVPKYLRDKLVPVLRDYIPAMIKRNFKELVHLTYVAKQYGFEDMYAHIPDKIFCKFDPFIGYYCQPQYFDKELYAKLYTCDHVALVTRWHQLVKILDGFYLDELELIQALHFRNLWTTHWLKSVQAYFAGQVSFSSYEKYHKLYSFYAKFYSEHFADAQ